MADIAATNVTLSISPRDRDLGANGMDKKLVAGTISFGDGALTYPANGVPLPAIGNFNMVKKLDRMFIEQPVDLIEYRYDATNHTIRMYQYLTGAAENAAACSEFSGAITAVTIGFLATGE